MVSDQHDVLTRLFFLLVCADGEVNHRELAIGKKMAAFEGLEEEVFHDTINQLKLEDQNEIYSTCIEKLQQLDKDTQILCMAWMSAIAKADGYVASKEGKLIHEIFFETLEIELQETIEKQKEILNKIGVNIM